MPPGDHRNLAAFVFHLFQQRRLLLGLHFRRRSIRAIDLDLAHRSLLLELQKESPEGTTISFNYLRRYTPQTGRLLSKCTFVNSCTWHKREMPTAHDCDRF